MFNISANLEIVKAIQLEYIASTPLGNGSIGDVRVAYSSKDGGIIAAAWLSYPNLQFL